MTDFDPDPLVAALTSEEQLGPSTSPQTVAFIGFLGATDDEDVVRLYLDEELRDWFDVAKADVLNIERRGEGVQQRTILWVDRRTTLQRRQAQPEDLQGDYLSGDVAAAMVPQAAMIVALDVSSIVRTWAKWLKLDYADDPGSGDTSYPSQGDDLR
jgi:hypothetical protein